MSDTVPMIKANHTLRITVVCNNLLQGNVTGISCLGVKIQDKSNLRLYLLLQNVLELKEGDVK